MPRIHNPKPEPGHSGVVAQHPTRGDLNDLFSHGKIADTHAKIGANYSLGDAISLISGASPGQTREWRAAIADMKRKKPQLAAKLEATITECLHKGVPITFEFEDGHGEWSLHPGSVLPPAGAVTIKVRGPSKPPG